MASTAAELDELVKGKTVPAGFLATVAAHADQVALRWMEDETSFGEMTYGELGDRVARAAAGLRSLGVSEGDRVVMMFRNIPEFHVADLAVMFCGATPVSIYNSSAPEQISYLVNHCEASVALLEDADFLDRFLKVRDELSELGPIVLLHEAETMPENTHPWSVLTEQEPVDLAAAADLSSPDDLATIIYTSGTTGNPKGVMISHYNVCWTVESFRESLGWPDEDYSGTRVISYLPMAHIAERMVSHYGNIFYGYEITCCPDPGLIANYAREVHPELIFGVPRVWEKVYGGVQGALGLDPEKKEKVDEAVAAAGPIREKITWGTASKEEIETYEFLDSVAFSTIRELVGLDQVRLAVTGAAPIPAEMLAWFRTIGVPLAEVYGLSETTGPMTFSAEKVKPGTVGVGIPGCDVALADDGEVICRGGNVFIGYLNEPEKTAEVLDDDGWFHSGDIGEIDDDGYVRIVDRKKELIITAGGKNVSPANLEAALKTIPLVGQAMAVGDDQRFIAALVVLDPEITPVWAAQNGLEGLSLEELAENKTVIAEVDAGLEGAMSEFNSAESVKKLKVLGEEWLPDSDLLTPTSKLKRRGIKARYDAEIESLYS